jgi:PAS domain S-box-containing protein
MRYRRLFETAKDGILILDADTGVINDVNPFLLNMLGYAFADIVGKKLWDIGMFTDVEASKNDFRELQQNRYIRYEDLPLRKRDGQLLDVEYISNVYQVDGDKVIQCNIRDITDRKKAEAQVKILDAFLEKRAADLERANRELEAFSYTVSHDLHTPLTNISSFCQLVQDQCAANLDDQCRKHLQEIYAGVERMNGLIATLLEFSRLSHCTLHPAAVDLTETAMVIAVELSLTNLQRHVTLNIADNMTVNGDGKLLHIALANLLGNAWKYTEKTAAAVIDFGCADQAGKQVYFVRDNGAGFNMAQVDKLFSAFNRLEGAEEYTGMGIGLATVKRIIERHGGKVWGEGEAGSGATFYFTLDTSLSRECAELGSRPDTVTGKATAPLAATGIAGT